MITDQTRKKLSEQKLGNKNPNWNGGKPKCPICGEAVSRYKNVKYCIKCYGDTVIGENNPAWKGGVNSDIKHRNSLSLHWYHNNKDYHRNFRFKKKFGITLEDYNVMLDKQDYKCAICREKKVYSRRKYLSVDHCHKTGRVRGLLCDACNLGLGKFNDNPDLLVRAVTYLS